MAATSDAEASLRGAEPRPTRVNCDAVHEARFDVIILLDAHRREVSLAPERTADACARGVRPVCCRSPRRSTTPSAWSLSAVPTSRRGVPSSVMDYRGTFLFPVSPEDLWASIERFDRFESWWGWLSEFRVSGDRLRTGAVLSGVVTPPLPYRIRIRAELLECVPTRWVKASVAGDLVGDATLALSPTISGTEVAVRWRVEMMPGSMRAAARVAYPLMRWGHDRVVEHSVEGFRRHLETEPP